MNQFDESVLERVPTGLLIAGEWSASSDSRVFAVNNPATGELLAHVSDATAADGLRALDAASASAAQWASTSPRQRSDILRGAFELLQQRKRDVASLMTLEMGKPIGEAYDEVVYGGEFLRWFSEEAVRINGRYGVNPEGTGRMVVSHRPVGPCYLITPWNFPLAMATRKIGPALAAGCTVVIKPAELTPLTTLYIAALLIEAGLPSGVVNVVPTTRPSELSGPLLSDPRLRKLSFTGSTPVGRALLKQAADGVLRTSMELGGNAPFVVFDDADVDAAVQGAMLAKFRNVGQACTAANRFIVHESVADEFARKLSQRVADLRVGNGDDPKSDIGPLINAAAVAKVGSLVRDATDRGSLTLGDVQKVSGAGSFYPPTVLHRVPAESRILREEIFGPVVAISVFTEEREAVRLANDSEYGLVAYVYTQSLARSQRMIDQIDTGMMAVNSGTISNAAAPFGGVKESGLGREGGVEGIHEFLETKYTLIPG